VDYFLPSARSIFYSLLSCFFWFSSAGILLALQPRRPQDNSPSRNSWSTKNRSTSRIMFAQRQNILSVATDFSLINLIAPRFRFHRTSPKVTAVLRKPIARISSASQGALCKNVYRNLNLLNAEVRSTTSSQLNLSHNSRRFLACSRA
jgi:hypothetical protein